MSENTEMESKDYIAVTIGPILDTMSLVNSPSALWASSFIFSWICKSLCEEIYKSSGKRDIFISPAYPDDEDKLFAPNKKGVGIFHDRIIFEAYDGFSWDKFNMIKSCVIANTAKKFELDKEYLSSYVLIAAVRYNSTSPILDSGKRLDSIELAKVFRSEEENINPIVELFNDKHFKRIENEQGAEKRAAKIVQIAEKNLEIKKDDWQLTRGKTNNLRSLSDIASASLENKAEEKNKDGLKRVHYYAIVRSDGDNISNIIASIKNKEGYKNFSKACIEYCGEIADMVGKYRGMTVYAGGDDLLAILPCFTYVDEDNKEAKTVLDFVSDANKIFDEKFKSYIDNEKAEKKPSLSFGIYICHEKHPLYEALEQSAKLLFYTAKAESKNRTALRLVKHSGQQSEIIIPNGEPLGAINELIGKLIKVKETREVEKAMLSALYKINEQKELFREVAHLTEQRNFFANVFDGPSPVGKVFLHETLPDYYSKMISYAMSKEELTSRKQRSSTETKAKKTKNKYPEMLEATLRIAEFYVESKGERE